MSAVLMVLYLELFRGDKAGNIPFLASRICNQLIITKANALYRDGVKTPDVLRA